MNKIKNIIVSGTNFWNPGDDFVRDGVIRIVKEIYEGYKLNFHFYNFNQDYFPQSKFSGIHNMVSNGDLEQLKDFIDAIVIAGLSAGNEIKDLYNWIIKNNLTDRVYLIGAGYENSYVDTHIKVEPEVTIFKNAKVITGRTAKYPKLIDELNLPYFHINCPAILSVTTPKKYSNKKIMKIGFSIQLPHEIGISNHSCAKEMYLLGIQLFSELSNNYYVEIVAHHKSEYFHFLNLFKENNINLPVRFSSFYQDLSDIYQGYDIVITTRLHSSLYANGFGIPGIIINDTDRHTHCLEGFQHSYWVNNKEKFYEVFNSINDLRCIHKELITFKKLLMEKYLDVLGEYFLKEEELYRRRIKRKLIRELTNVKIKKRVLDIISRLEIDYYLKRNIINLENSITENLEYFDTVIFLNWFANKFNPKNYLEIGVRRGRSMSQVISQSQNTNVYGIDLLVENYSSNPENFIFTTNPGYEFVIKEMKKFGNKSPFLISGDSKYILPNLRSDNRIPNEFELILVDGDHSYAGAKSDLEFCLNHLSPSGVLIFDDIKHSAHPELEILWEELKNELKNYLFLEDFAGTGTGILIKPPFDRFLE